MVDKRVIIDAGTGIRLLGKKIMIEEQNLLDADLFFTHTHMDHIQGLPFFAPLYNPNSKCSPSTRVTLQEINMIYTAL